MTDLAVFLLARIADDESLARQAGDHALDDLAGATAAARINRMQFAHFHHWSPSRVLAECEAKRRIIDKHRHMDDVVEVEYESEHMEDGWQSEAKADALEYAMRCLALPYADHADYREEWRP